MAVLCHSICDAPRNPSSMHAACGLWATPAAGIGLLVAPHPTDRCFQTSGKFQVMWTVWASVTLACWGVETRNRSDIYCTTACSSSSNHGCSGSGRQWTQLAERTRAGGRISLIIIYGKRPKEKKKKGLEEGFWLTNSGGNGLNLLCLLRGYTVLLVYGYGGDVMVYVN